MLWHAELGQSLTEVWTGTRHRGAQLHRLEHAVSVWAHVYGQRAWFRQLDITATADMEDTTLATINEFSGRAFPRTGGLAKHWILGWIRGPARVAALGQLV